MMIEVDVPSGEPRKKRAAFGRKGAIVRKGMEMVAGVDCAPLGAGPLPFAHGSRRLGSARCQPHASARHDGRPTGASARRCVADPGAQDHQIGLERPQRPVMCRTADLHGPSFCRAAAAKATQNRAVSSRTGFKNVLIFVLMRFFHWLANR